MSRVREVTPKVFDMLKTYPATRSDDKLLVEKVYTTYYNVDPMEPFVMVLRRRGLPSFESIRRARQRIQEYCEEMRAEDPVESIRIAEQEDYIAYSREEPAI